MEQKVKNVAKSPEKSRKVCLLGVYFSECEFRGLFLAYFLFWLFWVAFFVWGLNCLQVAYTKGHRRIRKDTKGHKGQARQKKYFLQNSCVATNLLFWAAFDLGFYSFAG